MAFWKVVRVLSSQAHIQFVQLLFGDHFCDAWLQSHTLPCYPQDSSAAAARTNRARLLLLQQPGHSSLPTVSSVVKPGPPSLRLSPVAWHSRVPTLHRRFILLHRIAILLHGSTSILRNCTFECVDHRQLNARLCPRRCRRSESDRHHGGPLPFLPARLDSPQSTHKMLPAVLRAE